ncbi:hypothetical protein AB0O75_34425 [Streptomyces sp. NPDC088921]|uniref:hypothetical protein n=1 Tax=unclassified Streptomyces TaxID=2593676 RepID=UPI00342ED2B3
MAIRAQDDAEWALGLEEARPRPVQLMVGGTYGDRSLSARPLRRPTKNGLSVGVEWWTKLRQQRAAPAGLSVLKAQVHGQISLFTVPRVLGGATVSAVVGRSVAGWEQARQVIEAMEAEHGLTAGWRRKVAEMVRLALVVREAEGVERLPEAMLRDLPANGDAVRLIPLRAGFLDEAPEPMRFSGGISPLAPHTTPIWRRFRLGHRASAPTATPGFPSVGGQDSFVTRAGTGGSGRGGAGAAAAAATGWLCATTAAGAATATASSTKPAPPPGGSRSW